LAFKESECDKIIAVIYSHSNEIKVDSLLSFKRYKKIVDYVNKKGLVKDGFYIYFLYEPGEDQGISNSAISDLSFVDLLPMKCSIMKDITPK
jgi:hypothetical protein